ncbi:hypothetical protein MF672_009735 [Actinomadura sp. ATCC 31491]|uniref:Uncharacterized protein n=1 Tax=Actinomadura luzonensis TaxID=2805427 RepID=A0ABT0FP28_9ACTN|nr:hypothetical protein [Actinomadura luzonensis]MCK2214067.1 hypothetical protein [Actinomadura luzonensis]
MNSIWETGHEAGYEAAATTVIGLRPGWPLPCTFGYADLPEPHDPRDALTADLLRAPELKWKPVGRRSMADRITDELRAGGHLRKEQYVDNYLFDAYNMGDQDPLTTCTAHRCPAFDPRGLPSATALRRRSCRS